MKKIYDHQKLCHHKKMAIPQNIRLGEMMSELLNGVNPKLLAKVIISLKKEYMEDHNEILNTKEKKDHVQMVLDSIAKGKYNFAKQNIEQGEKFNSFYPEVQIPLPTQERNFPCVHCKERYFKTNASLHSHYRSCPKMVNQLEQEQEVKLEEKEGFRPVRKREYKQVQQKAKKIKVDILQYEMEEEKKQKIKEESEFQLAAKRDMPRSTYSFVSDIFFEEEN